MRPIHEMLLRAQGHARFHMPGHKGALDPFDMTELPSTDDLYHPQGAIREAERRIAQAAGAGDAILLTGGATAGNLTMLLYASTRYRAIRMERTAHVSAVSGLVLGDMEVGESGAVFATRPDYFGRAGALPKAELLLVDEAHGAHFNWWDSPPNAGQLGADLWVQSAHKTLPALTGGAWLLMKDARLYPQLLHLLRMVMTSSPPFPILRALDDARALMDERGAQLLEQTVARCDALRAKVNAMPSLTCPRMDDPTRIVVDVSGRGLTGFHAARLLGQMGVDVEMGGAREVVCIATVCDTPASFAKLEEALRRLPEGKDAPADFAPVYGVPRMRPRQAALAPIERVPLAQAAGRIAAQAAGLYPPGSAWLMPGDEIPPEAIEALEAARRAGAGTFGLADGEIAVVRQ